MIDLAVLLEESDLIESGFNPQDEVEIGVHFDGKRPHLVSNATAQSA